MRTRYAHLKVAGGGVYIAEPASGRMIFRNRRDTDAIAALHNAFPALLALARDGERYREQFSTSETSGLLVAENAAIDAARKGEKP